LVTSWLKLFMEKPLTLKKKIGIIDLGSNSARLMVAHYTSGQAYRVTDEVSRRVRLSEGMGRDKVLQPAAMERAIETLKMFQAFCAANEIATVLPVATAAVRDAANRAEFLQQVARTTRLKLRVLTGEEEAYFGVLGVVNGLGLRAGLVMDVGGGSAEVSEVRASRFVRGMTSALGAVRLTELFLPAAGRNRVKKGDVARLQEHIAEVFRAIGWMTLRPTEQLVGVGGTARALARIDRESRHYPLDLLNGYVLKQDRIEALITRLIACPIDERPRKILGLQNDRADIILAGALVWAGALRQAGAAAVTVCAHGLRDGLLFREFLKPADPPLIPNLREFSVHNLGRLCGYEAPHVAHVAHLALALFDQLAHQHGDGDWERDCLWAAAHLHDIGTVVDYADHHKHSAYLILNAGLPGYTHRELVLIAQVCLYHRKGEPDTRLWREVLTPGDAERTRRLAALVRLAEYLDRSRTQAVARVQLEPQGRKRLRLRVTPRRAADARVEVWEAQRNADLFEAAFDCKLDIALD
jgi:exopolyphosphatase/guanosine-5'-triphosphate,3'-diphosphate pyrophosphatase